MFTFYDGNNIGILKSNENDFRQFSFVSLFNSLVSLFDEWKKSDNWPINLKVKLDALLAAPDALQLHQWRLLISGTHRKLIQRSALDSVLSIYGQLYGAVHNSANGYQNPKIIMPRTPEQVQALLLWIFWLLEQYIFNHLLQIYKTIHLLSSDFIDAAAASILCSKLLAP